MLIKNGARGHDRTKHRYIHHFFTELAERGVISVSHQHSRQYKPSAPQAEPVQPRSWAESSYRYIESCDRSLRRQINAAHLHCILQHTDTVRVPSSTSHILPGFARHKQKWLLDDDDTHCCVLQGEGGAVKMTNDQPKTTKVSLCLSMYSMCWNVRRCPITALSVDQCSRALQYPSCLHVSSSGMSPVF